MRPATKLFVDYAGDGVPVVFDRLTGKQRSARIFVCRAWRLELHLRTGTL
jgi:transposase